MRVSGYLKAIILILLLAAPAQAEAGIWNYRCMLLSGSLVSCQGIGDAASHSVTSAFISKYPSDKYLILFTANANEYSDGGFSYIVVASLHEKRDKGSWVKFPSIAAHSYEGYSSNPSYARQRQFLLRGAEKATADLVSDVTGR